MWNFVKKLFGKKSPEKQQPVPLEVECKMVSLFPKQPPKPVPIKPARDLRKEFKEWKANCMALDSLYRRLAA